MRIVNPSYEILTPIDGRAILKHLEQCGRQCYQSQHLVTDDSYLRFIRLINERGHGSVLEHFSISVLFQVDRGVTHEMVRHRLASFSQESTRYCNFADDKFGNELTFINPCFWNEDDDNQHLYFIWRTQMEQAEKTYLELIEKGAQPQEARAVLPNSLASKIVITANLREWQLIFSQRASRAAHPQMQEIMIPLLLDLQCRIPIIFDKVVEELTW